MLSAGADLRLKIWSAEDGSCPRTLTGHTRGMYGYIWAGRGCLVELPKSSLPCLAGISDTAIIDRGRNIVCKCCFDHYLCIVDKLTNTEFIKWSLDRLVLLMTSSVLLSICVFLPAVSSDGTARLWDCGSGRCLSTLAKVRCPINSCALAASSIVGERNTTPPTGKGLLRAQCSY